MLYSLIVICVLFIIGFSLMISNVRSYTVKRRFYHRLNLELWAFSLAIIIAIIQFTFSPIPMKILFVISLIGFALSLYFWWKANQFENRFKKENIEGTLSESIVASTASAYLQMLALFLLAMQYLKIFFN